MTKSLSVFAPAKINLYLHVTGRRDDGYHLLDSLIAFADIGDQIRIEPAQDFQFEINGDFAASFQAKDRDASPSSGNLVVQGAWALARAAQKTPGVKAVLQKTLPLGAGLGGGSSDAAAMIWALCEYWDIPRNTAYLPELMTRLGADVPVCFLCQAARIRGIGDLLDPVPEIPEMPIILVHPAKPCITADIFMHYGGAFSEPLSIPPHFGDHESFVAFLHGTRNDLYETACQAVPDIANVIHALEAQQGCAIARMSGSGSSCFGLFETQAQAENATAALQRDNPDWWITPGHLGRSGRY